jgi:membrane-bound lytic murein transglycosylase D
VMASPFNLKFEFWIPNPGRSLKPETETKNRRTAANFFHGSHMFEHCIADHSLLLSPGMKTPWLIAFLCATLPAFGQDSTITLDDVIDSAQQWAGENLDENTLRTLQNADREKVKQFFDALQSRFHGEYVLDLVPWRDTARTILPLLETHDETLPYSVWLKTRMDYFDAADELRLLVPPPKTEPGKPVPRPPNPPPAQEREVWIKKISTRPWPAAAKPYVATLKPIFAKQKTPPELVWLAEVESSFDPRARSPAGAAGLFQLMPATAKQYGLSIWPSDQRLKPEPSAAVAAKHLEYLHGRFKDWRLSVAAYNAGEGTVQRLLNRHKATSYDAIATYLPAETQLYVPKVEATLLQREGVKLDQLALHTKKATAP